MIRNVLVVLLLRLIVAEENLSKEECIAIERSQIPRRTPKAVSVQEGSPAYLHCAVPFSTDNLVAWTRLSDDALLTAGGQSFTSDARFQVSPKRQTRDWVLIIRRVQMSDTGCYLCEINTEPMSTLLPVFLNVVKETQPTEEEKASAHHKRSSQLVATMEGDSLLLNCTVEVNEHEGAAIDITWTHDQTPIDMFNDKKYQTNYKMSRNAIVYTLRIADVSSQDDGLYACEGEELPRSAQMVHVNSNGQASWRTMHLTSAAMSLLLVSVA